MNKPLRIKINKDQMEILKINIESNEKILSEKLKEENLKEEIIAEKFVANKTSKNGLSLFTRREFNELMNKEQPPEIINFFKFFCLIFENKIFPYENDTDFIRLLFERTFPENSNLSKNLNPLKPLKFRECYY